MILLDSVLAKAKENYPSSLKEDEVFELYCADNILINYDLDYAEIESGIVDGPRDAGIDAAYIFVNTQLLTDDLDLLTFRQPVELELYLIQAKNEDSFNLKKALSTSWRCRCCSAMQRGRKIWSRYSRERLSRSAGHF